MSRIEDTRPSYEGERNAALVYVLQRLWTYSFTTKSDEARAFADEIAEAASRGFISTIVRPEGGLYGRLWKLTPQGLVYLYLNADALEAEEAAYVTRHASSL
jgi:hypothetical protein